MPTRYVVRAYTPAYSVGDEKEVITVEVVFGWTGEFNWESEFVRVRGQGHGERVAISSEQGMRFLEAMDLIPPKELRSVIDPLPGQMDYMGIEWRFLCQIQRDDGTRHEFEVSHLYLSCARAAWQRAFMRQIVGLAGEVIRRPKTVHLLKQARDAIHGRRQLFRRRLLLQGRALIRWRPAIQRQTPTERPKLE